MELARSGSVSSASIRLASSFRPRNTSRPRSELQARESTTTDLALPWIARAGFESPPRQAGVMLGCQLDVPSEKG
jgi:hypothetical protein